MTLPRAKEAFRFFTRQSLAVVTGSKASTLPELLVGLRHASDGVIYQHTHRFLQQHQFLVPEPSNDLAVWAIESLGDERLGERLAALDTVSYPTIRELRDAIIALVEGHLKRGADASRSSPEGEEFHFMDAVRFSLPTPHEAWDLAEFAEGLKKVSLSSLYLHVFEARLRPPLGVNDFSFWFEKELGEKTLAKAVANLDPYAQSLEGLRGRILGILEKRLEELSRA